MTAEKYVQAVLAEYTRLPSTPDECSRRDRRLARQLFQANLSLDKVRAALLLGAARRTLRSRAAPPLPPVRTLHYFLPVLEEILEQPPEPDYLDYLKRKLQPMIDEKHARQRKTLLDFLKDNGEKRSDSGGQKTAVSGCR